MKISWRKPRAQILSTLKTLPRKKFGHSKLPWIETNAVRRKKIDHRGKKMEKINYIKLVKKKYFWKKKFLSSQKENLRNFDFEWSHKKVFVDQISQKLARKEKKMSADFAFLQQPSSMGLQACKALLSLAHRAPTSI